MAEVDRKMSLKVDSLSVEPRCMHAESSRWTVWKHIRTMRESFNPTAPKLFIDFDEIRTLELPPEDHPPCKISFRSNNVGGLGEYPVCHCH